MVEGQTLPGTTTGIGSTPRRHRLKGVEVVDAGKSPLQLLST